jgi:TonB family protein
MDSRVSRESRLRQRTKRLARATLFVAGGGLTTACRSSTPPREASGSGPTTALSCSQVPKRGDAVEFDKSRMLRPKLSKHPATPVLTESIRSQGLEGQVDTRCIINVDGTLEDCCIWQSGGELDQPVIDAVRTWRYEPAAIEGKPVKTFYVIQVKIVQK